MKELNLELGELCGHKINPRLLRYDGFVEALTDWLQVRVEKRNRITPSGAKRALRKLHAVPPPEAVAMLEAAADGGWSGLWPIRSKAARQAPENKRDLSKIRRTYD